MSHFKPQSFEMVSRVGKQFDEKLGSQKLLEEIANPTRKLRLQNSSKKTKLLPPADLIALLDSQEKETSRPKVIKIREKRTADYVFTRQSRQDYYMSTVRCRQRKEDSVPPIGYYSPNFAPVQRTHLKPVSWSKQTLGERPRRIDEGLKRFGTTRPFPIRSIPAFGKQLARKEVTFGLAEPHELRFALLPQSLVHSKSHRVCTTDMAKTRSREELFPLSDAPNPDYQAKYEAVWTPVARKLDFSRTASRKDLKIPINDLSYDNISYEQVVCRVKSPDFSRMRSRPSGSNSPFPLFMRSLASWQGLSGVNEKTLQLSGALPVQDNSPRSLSYMPSGGERSPMQSIQE